MEKVYASVYGCPSNIADYEMGLGLLRENGFEIVESQKKSGLNIIFTCIVKTPTEQRMVRKIQELTKTGKPLIVAGCMPKTSQRVVEKMSPEASLVGPDSIENIVEAARSASDGKKVIFVKDGRKVKSGLPRVRKEKNVGIVPISIGCLSDCSYCSVKFARGKLRSYPAQNIVEEVRRFAGDGCTEIWLTSQDNGCYGFDIGITLPSLLKEVYKIGGDFKIRVGMMNPSYIKDKKILEELIESYKNDKIIKFLHLPVQSGSNRLLGAMRRGYTVNDFERIVKRFREKLANLFLSTDIIVGFPGETEKDLQATIELLRRTSPDKVNLSKFWSRPGTDAANMRQLPIELINRRSKKLHKLILSF